jgi:hypothetical protein
MVYKFDQWHAHIDNDFGSSHIILPINLLLEIEKENMTWNSD